MLCTGILGSGSRIARRRLGIGGGLCGLLGRRGGWCRGGLGCAAPFFGLGGIGSVYMCVCVFRWSGFWIRFE